MRRYTLLNFSTAVAALTKNFCTFASQLLIVNYLLMKNLYQKFLASTGVSTDTRNIAKGSIYFALKGASFNGNTFAAEALEKGAQYAVIDEAAYQTSDKMILVSDVLTTLQELATYHRNTLKTLVIGITGSNGKTTTKELIKSVLSQQLNVVATQGNLNNNIGVPLTLLSIKPETDIAIVEMGANHPGEIAFLCNIAQPDYGYITSIGKAHLEGFGSFEGVIQTKGELYDYLKAHQKTIIANADNPITEALLADYHNEYSFGVGKGVNVAVQCLGTQPVTIQFEDASTQTTEEGERVAIEGFTDAPTVATSHLVGSYNFTNIAAAVAFGKFFKLSNEAIKRGIEAYIPQNNRSQLMQWGSNTVLLDAYNANPSSMAAAIDNLLTMTDEKKKVLILGDMFELGNYAAEEHQRIVDKLKNYEWEGVYLVGSNFAKTQSPYPQYETFEAFKEVFPTLSFNNCLLLIKGSRGMALERLIQEVFTCKKLLMTKKKLPVRFTGQHFTIDKVLIKDAIRQANISNQDTVLDIGAGKGFLTVHLLKIANNVVAIENDTALVEHLRKLFSDARNVQVVGCDFRNFAVPKFPFKVVSNIPYGITSDIFKILMFESLGNFLGGSIVLQLEPTQKLFSRKLYNPYTVFYHTFFDLKLVYEVGPESFLPPPTVKSALLNIKRKHLFFDFKFKAKYLAFISCLLEKPDLSVKTALKSIFRKSQVRSISEKFGLNLNAQIVCLSPSQWLNCFLEMLEVVPEKFHPS